MAQTKTRVSDGTKQKHADKPDVAGTLCRGLPGASFQRRLSLRNTTGRAKLAKAAAALKCLPAIFSTMLRLPKEVCG